MVAEGWIALLKGDTTRARALFSTPSPRACIGQGVLYLLQGNYVEAGERLGFLHSHAISCLPALTQAMGWDRQDNRKEFSHLPVTHVPLEELLLREAATPPAQKEQKGFLWLKIGEEYAQKEQEKALASWKKAMTFCSSLELDVLKRRFHLSLDSEAGLDVWKEFFKFYRTLRKSAPEMACSFVEHLVFNSHLALHTHLINNELLSEKGKWVLDPPPRELQLLWIYLAYFHTLQKLDKVWPPSGAPDHIENLQWVDWEKLIHVLDAFYLKQEFYLHCRLTLAKIFRKNTLICDSIGRLIELNPHFKEELLPLYTVAARKMLQNREGESLHLRKLLERFPASFDLLRLLAACDPQEAHSLASARLSSALLSVFRLQVALDRGEGWEEWHKALLSSGHSLQLPEMNWRKISAFCDSRLKVSPKQWSALIEMAAVDDGAKHALFSKMAQYDIFPPRPVLKNWLQKRANNWRPRFHLARNYFANGQVDEGVKELAKVREMIHREGAPMPSAELEIVERTGDFYAFRSLMNLPELFRNLFMKDLL